MTTKYLMVWAALSLGAGILLEEYFCLSWEPLIIAGMISLALCGIGLYKCRKAAAAGAVLLLCATGMIRLGLAELEWQDQSSYLIGFTGTFTGVVTEEPAIYPGDDGYARYTADLERIALPGGETRPVKGKAYVYASLPSSYHTGDRLAFSGQLRKAALFKNPGKLDLEGRYKSIPLLGKIYVKEPLQFLEHTGRYKAKQRAEQIRNDITSYFEQHMKKDTAHLLSTLLFGGIYNEIPASVISSFSTTGIIHILSVSGSHISLLFGFCFLIGSWLHVPKRAVLALSFLTVAFYAFMSGFVPPVIRATAMGLISGGGLFFKRDKTALNVLGTAVAGMLFWNPFYIYDVSFQLSAGASAGILLFYRFLLNRLTVFSRIPRWIREGAALSCAAQWLIVPIILYDFHFFPLYFIPANLFITPLLEWSIIGGLIISVLSLISLPLLGSLAAGIGFLIEIAVKGNLFLSSLPKAQLGIGGMTFLQILLYFYITVFWYGYKTGEVPIFFRHPKWGCAAGLVLSSAVLAEWCLQPSLQVFVPDLGRDRGALILNKNTSIVYYRPNTFSSPLSPIELDSFLQYEGIFTADLLLLDLEDQKEPYSLGLQTKFDAVCLTKNQKSRYHEEAGTPCLILKNDKSYLSNNDIIITSNGSSWLADVSGKQIYFNGFRAMHGEKPEKLLWIGGSEGYVSHMKESDLLRLHPEAAVYVGKSGQNAAEEQELFYLHRIPLKNPDKAGMTRAIWNGNHWQFKDSIL